MQVFVFLSLLATTMAARQVRIVNGDEAKEGEHTYMASIQQRFEVVGIVWWENFCGGVIIDTDKILTAANCLENKDISNLRVMVGAHYYYGKKEPWEQAISIKKMVIHPQWDVTDIEHGWPDDIAVVYLSKEIDLSERVGLVQMPDQSNNFANSECLMLGWGWTYGLLPFQSGPLIEAETTLISKEACSEYFPANVTDKQVCGIDLDKETSFCRGDSGGPLMCGDDYEFLVGIASWTWSNCDGKHPSVFTRVTEYLDWITNPS